MATELDDPICFNPKNMEEVDLSEAFPGSKVSEACINIQSKLAQNGDQLMMDKEIESYINTNGSPVLYYPYLFEIDKAEHLYGEHSAAGYGNPFNIIMMTQIEDSPAFLGMQGFDSNETFTGWIHIKTFKNKVKAILTNTKDERQKDYSLIYNANYYKDKDVIRIIKPKEDDVIQLTLYGCDREWDKGNKMYKITNVEDELFSQNMNPVNGHYVWKITAVRFRPSWEEGMSRLDEKSKDNTYIGVNGEKGNHLVHEHMSVAKMFLAAEGIEYENVAENMQDEDSIQLMTESGLSVKEQILEKVYKHDIRKPAQAEYDMERIEKGYYTDNQSKVLSNGYF